MLSAADQLNQLREVAIAGDSPTPAPAPFPSPTLRATLGYDDAEAVSKKDRRRERKEFKAALKAVASGRHRATVP